MQEAKGGKDDGEMNYDEALYGGEGEDEHDSDVDEPEAPTRGKKKAAFLFLFLFRFHALAELLTCSLHCLRLHVFSSRRGPRRKRRGLWSPTPPSPSTFS